MFQGFWGELDKPIIGMSPMDGVTDAPMRFVTAKYGKPTVMFTEFTSVEGIAAGAERLMKDFIYDESERPVVAQIFGTEPTAFYKASIVVCALGFDGIDINMGCPAKSVTEHGAGAGLILNPDLAAEIIASVKRGIVDWNSGIKIEEIELKESILSYLFSKPKFERKMIPLSVKTRVGYDKPVVDEWISFLAGQDLAAISLHGRTLKQLYQGLADWNEIGKGAAIIHKESPGTVFIGNGDIDSLETAKKKIEEYDLDGVLLGRAAMGNPWVFKGKKVDVKERLRIAVEHAKKYEECFPGQGFLPMRKHLAWYCRGFDNASDLRQKLVLTNSASEVEIVLKDVLG